MHLRIGLPLRIDLTSENKQPVFQTDSSLSRPCSEPHSLLCTTGHFHGSIWREASRSSVNLHLLPNLRGGADIFPVGPAWRTFKARELQQIREEQTIEPRHIFFKR